MRMKAAHCLLLLPGVGAYAEYIGPPPSTAERVALCRAAGLDLEDTTAASSVYYGRVGVHTTVEP